MASSSCLTAVVFTMCIQSLVAPPDRTKAPPPAQANTKLTEVDLRVQEFGKSKEAFEKEFAIPNLKTLTPIASGVFGSVFRVKLEDNREFALKVDKKLRERERQALMALSPQKKPMLTFIPQMIKDFSLRKTTDSRFSTLAMTLTGPSIKMLVRGSKENISIPQRKRFVIELSKAVVALHEAGWCHGDLNPGNIVVSGQAGETNRFYLVDYGMSLSKSEEADKDSFPDCMWNDLEKVSKLATNIFGMSEQEAAAHGFAKFRELVDAQKYDELSAWVANEDKVTPKEFTNWIAGGTVAPEFVPVTQPYKQSQ